MLISSPCLQTRQGSRWLPRTATFSLLPPWLYCKAEVNSPVFSTSFDPVLASSSLWTAFQGICKKSFARVYVHTMRMGQWDPGRAGVQQDAVPACSSAELHGSNPPKPDFLLLACVLLCLPRAPNHSANSMCGERSPRVISGRIPPLYSWLINSGYRVRMSYRLQECPPRREVNITARAESPFLWQ